jgi:hypothetical protein
VNLGKNVTAMEEVIKRYVEINEEETEGVKDYKKGQKNCKISYKD